MSRLEVFVKEAKESERLIKEAHASAFRDKLKTWLGSKLFYAFEFDFIDNDAYFNYKGRTFSITLFNNVWILQLRGRHSVSVSTPIISVNGLLLMLSQYE